MKKFLSVIIPVILLTATAGVFVVNHFCMITGKTTANYTCCSRCTDECCKKELKVFRLTIETVKQAGPENLFAFDFTPLPYSVFSLTKQHVSLTGFQVKAAPVYVAHQHIIRTTVLII